jgi:hypothetical protein
MSDMVELHSQFSQVTRHAVAARKSENTPVNQVAEQDAPEGNVTLISKYLEACRAPEKIPPLAAPDDVWKADCETLSKMELRRHYSREANCHRNMLSRRKTQGAVVSPLFEDFRSFLKIVGPMPAKGTTLDRIDNADPEYAPGKVRWADKRTQNSNKGDSLLFHYSRTGDTYTTSRLAKLQNVSAAAIRKRFERGWSDDEIIEGKQAENVVTSQRPRSSEHSSQDADKYSSLAAAYRSGSAAAIAFARMAEHFQFCREEDGEEALICPLDEWNDLFSELVPPVIWTEEQYERKFRWHWPSHRPHLNFWNATPYHQKIIEKIDPEYVAKQKQEKQKREKLMESI